MSEGVGRYVKFTAQPGRGPEVMGRLLEAAESLRDTAGCELYLINRATERPDEIWVTELWMNQESVDASLEALRTDAGRTRLSELTALLAEPPQRIDLEPVGGVGYVAGAGGYTHLNLAEVEDMAPRFGLDPQLEARFATRPLAASRTGVSHQRLRPGARQPFGHRHRHAEEVVVVLAGSGQVKIDDELRDVRPLDAIRFAPGSARAFQAGPDGLDLLVFGPHHTGDAVLDQSFWPTEEDT